MKATIALILLIIFLLPFVASAQMQTVTTSESTLDEGQTFQGPWVIKEETKRQVTGWFSDETDAEIRTYYFCDDNDKGINPGVKAITKINRNVGEDIGSNTVVGSNIVKSHTDINDINHDNSIVEYYCVTNVTTSTHTIGRNQPFQEVTATRSIWSVNVDCNNNASDGACIGSVSSCPEGYQSTDGVCTPIERGTTVTITPEPCSPEGLRECTDDYTSYRTCSSGSWTTTKCGKSESCILGECKPKFKCDAIEGVNRDSVNVNGIRITTIFNGQEQSEERLNECSPLPKTMSNDPVEKEVLNFACDNVNTQNAQWEDVPDRKCNLETHDCNYRDGKAVCLDKQTGKVVKQESGGIRSFLRRLFGLLFSFANPIFNLNLQSEQSQEIDDRTCCEVDGGNATFEKVAEIYAETGKNLIDTIFEGIRDKYYIKMKPNYCRDLDGRQVDNSFCSQGCCLKVDSNGQRAYEKVYKTGYCDGDIVGDSTSCDNVCCSYTEISTTFGYYSEKKVNLAIKGDCLNKPDGEVLADKTMCEESLCCEYYNERGDKVTKRLSKGACDYYRGAMVGEKEDQQFLKKYGCSPHLFSDVCCKYKIETEDEGLVEGRKMMKGSECEKLSGQKGVVSVDHSLYEDDCVGWENSQTYNGEQSFPRTPSETASSGQESSGENNGQQSVNPADTVEISAGKCVLNTAFDYPKLNSIKGLLQSPTINDNRGSEFENIRFSQAKDISHTYDDGKTQCFRCIRYVTQDGSESFHTIEISCSDMNKEPPKVVGIKAETKTLY